MTRPGIPGGDDQRTAQPPGRVLRPVPAAVYERRPRQPRLWKARHLSHRPEAEISGTEQESLTDGLYGGTTYVENWVGWEGTDAAFVIDLGAPTAIHSITTDFLRQLGAWILMPMQVRYSASLDGKDYAEIATIDLPEDRGNKVEFIPVTATCETTARYIQVEVTGTKTCPEWHYGVGNPCWFFIDEVIVK
ncbi:MAG: discoidin domain-containing protein [Bacteroidales bacterium]|nr:discoidin domain-containing protein [Bacteroidales bacterium]